MAAPVSVKPEFTPVPKYVWIGRAGDTVLAALFLLLIAVPAVIFFASEKRPHPSPENRTFARAPRFGDDPAELLPQRIDAYFGDYFGFRSTLVRLDSVLRYQWLGLSSKRLVVGRDGWAFFAGDRVFENHMGLDPFTPAELAAWRSYLEQRQAAAAAKGARYLFVVAPDKASVYPEMLPSSMRVEPGHSRLDQLLAYLRDSGSSASVLDLRGALLAAKGEGLVYYPQDTHWNGRGYFAGYVATCNTLRRYFPQIRPLTLGKDYEVVRRSWGIGNWSQVGLPELNLRYPSDFLVPLGAKQAHRVPLEIPAPLAAIHDPEHMAVKMVDESAPYRLVFFHDSFLYTGIPDRLQTPFAETFGESVFAGLYPTDAQLLSLVQSQHPDIVLEERVERFLAGSPAR